MNDLSWLLYLADVIPSVGSFWGGAVIFTLIALLVGNVVKTIATARHNDFEYKEKDKKPYTLIPHTGKLVAAALVGGTLLAFIPSTKTFYMIAASEAGEAVITNPEAQQIFDALKERIKAELALADVGDKKP